MDIRLVSSGPANEGYLEVYHEGQWGTVCDMYFMQEAADVVCRQLGFTGISEPVWHGELGQGTGPSLLYEIMCMGYETHINECMTYFYYDMCTHSQDAGVRCGQEGAASAAGRSLTLG